MSIRQFLKGARPARPGSAHGGGLASRMATRVLVGLLVGLLGAVSVAHCGDEPEASGIQAGTLAVEPIPAPRHPRQKTYLKRKWGVEILFLRETAGGHMLELRYKVLDPDKAAGLFVRKTRPALLHVASGARLSVPAPAKTGPLRNSDRPLADHTYWMLFANPNRVVRAGDSVNLQIGEFAVEGLVVSQEYRKS